MKIKFDSIQHLGRALMLPIALLPVAGILLRIGQPDLLNIKYIADAGNIIFSNLAILFALGIAVGLAKDNNGTAALAACVGYFIMTTILVDINKDINTGVLGGILIGIVTASLYNRYKDIKLPAYLAFFGGKRFIPIITGLLAVVIGVVLGHVWPPIQNGINNFGNWLLIDGGAIGLFIYGFLNRILIITGLHHVLNNLVWFVFGSYTNSSGNVVHGDIARFMAGDKTAGEFMSGYFPIMMFGLPAACLAMYKNALTENKKAIAGLLLSMALTSILTGVTEPIEFSFVFLAPLLFLIHAILTGLSLSIMYLLDVHLGFTFSAGLIDYIMFFKFATNPLYLLPIGLIIAVIYYIIFDFFIRRYDLRTIGRDLKGYTPVSSNSITQFDSPRALQFIEALGGASNIIAIDSCMTRLRLTVVDSANINSDVLTSLGSMGHIAPSTETLQVIIGTAAELIASEIRETLSNTHKAHAIKQKPVANNGGDVVIDVLIANVANDILIALGGKKNISAFDLVALTRIRVEVHDQSRISLQLITSIPNITLLNISPVIKQIYVGDNAEKVYWAVLNHN